MRQGRTEKITQFFLSFKKNGMSPRENDLFMSHCLQNGSSHLQFDWTYILRECREGFEVIFRVIVLDLALHRN